MSDAPRFSAPRNTRVPRGPNPLLRLHVQWPFLNPGNTELWNRIPQLHPTSPFSVLNRRRTSHQPCRRKPAAPSSHRGRDWSVAGLSTVFTLSRPSRRRLRLTSPCRCNKIYSSKQRRLSHPLCRPPARKFLSPSRLARRTQCPHPLRPHCFAKAKGRQSRHDAAHFSSCATKTRMVPDRKPICRRVYLVTPHDHSYEFTRTAAPSRCVSARTFY